MLLSFALASSSLLQGYEFQVTQLQAQGPLTKDQIRMDDNGDAECGLLKLQTDIDNIEFHFSMLGTCGVEKTADGYDIYLTQNTEHITLKAPGFKSLHWEFNLPEKGIKKQQYAAQIKRAGKDPASFSAEGSKIEGKFQFISLGLYSRYMGGQTATLIVNTDIPLTALQKDFLIPGSYTLSGDTHAAPYYLSVKPGTLLKEVFRADQIGICLGKSPWRG